MPFISTLTVFLVDCVMRLENRRFKTRLPPIKRRRKIPSREQQAAFLQLWSQTLQQGPNALIDYNIPYLKIDFLNYLCDYGSTLVPGGIAAHGSNQGDLPLLEPVRKSSDVTEFGNRQQIFATTDAIYAAWFAILDKNRYQSTHNACMRVGPEHGNWVKVYYYHLKKEFAAAPPYAPGFIYLCRNLDFPSRRIDKLYATFGLELEECGSAQPVQPLARMYVEPIDFPYLDQVEFVL